MIRMGSEYWSSTLKEVSDLIVSSKDGCPRSSYPSCEAEVWHKMNGSYTVFPSPADQIIELLPESKSEKIRKAKKDVAEKTVKHKAAQDVYVDSGELFSNSENEEEFIEACGEMGLNNFKGKTEKETQTQKKAQDLAEFLDPEFEDDLLEFSKDVGKQIYKEEIKTCTEDEENILTPGKWYSEVKYKHPTLPIVHRADLYRHKEDGIEVIEGKVKNNLNNSDRVQARVGAMVIKDSMNLDKEDMVYKLKNWNNGRTEPVKANESETNKLLKKASQIKGKEPRELNHNTKNCAYCSVSLGERTKHGQGCEEWIMESKKRP